MNEYGGNIPSIGNVKTRLDERFYALKLKYPTVELPKQINDRMLGLENFIDKEGIGRMQVILSGPENFDADLRENEFRKHTVELARRLDELEMMIAEIGREREIGDSLYVKLRYALNDFQWEMPAEAKAIEKRARDYETQIPAELRDLVTLRRLNRLYATSIEQLELIKRLWIEGVKNE